jgi:uncharacterized membrane protein YgcG
MVSILALLSRASEHLGPLSPLALVPFALAVVSVEKFRRVAGSTADLRFGISFGFPTTVSTSWDLLSLPNAGSGLNLPTESIETTVPLMLVVTVLSALLGAGYLGSIRRELASVDRAFLEDARTYFGPFLGFELINLVVVLAAVGAALVALPLALAFVLVLFAFAYLFYATPYLVVVEGVDLPTALRRSYGYAASGGEYASFFVQYLIAVALVSVVATPPFTTSIAGAALGTVVLAPVALLFDTATMLFVRDLTGATGHEDGGGPDGMDDPDEAGDSGGTGEAGTGTGPGSGTGGGREPGGAAAGQSNMPVET